MIAHFDAAFFLRAVDDELSILDHVLGVEMQAGDMEGMPALEVRSILSL